MTVSKAVSNWLSQIDSLIVDTNHLKDEADKYGLFKSPMRRTTEFNDGSYEITEYYQFFARQASVSEDDRVDSDQWLEDLSYTADDAGIIYALPVIDDTRRVTKLELTGAPYPMETGSSDTLYQMSLSITYIREREV